MHHQESYDFRRGDDRRALLRSFSAEATLRGAFARPSMTDKVTAGLADDPSAAPSTACASLRRLHNLSLDTVVFPDNDNTSAQAFWRAPSLYKGESNG